MAEKVCYDMAPIQGEMSLKITADRGLERCSVVKSFLSSISTNHMGAHNHLSVMGSEALPWHICIHAGRAFIFIK